MPIFAVIYKRLMLPLKKFQSWLTALNTVLTPWSPLSSTNCNIWNIPPSWNEYYHIIPYCNCILTIIRRVLPMRNFKKKIIIRYPVKLLTLCNVTFTAGNIFHSHSCIGMTWVKPPLGYEPVSPAWEADDLPTELSLPP